MDTDISQNGTLITQDHYTATVDKLLHEDTQAGRKAREWGIVGIGTTVLALAAMGLAYIGWFTRPEVVPLVQFVHVDAEGVTRMISSPLPMEQYTVEDRQWTEFLYQWVLRLRWRGIDVVQAQQAWKWLKLHTCGMGTEQHQRYFELERPLDNIGVKKREIRNITVTKTDMPGVFTVSWEEHFIDGIKPGVESQQTAHVAVGRRPVTKDMKGINEFGVCIKAFGGLSL